MAQALSTAGTMHALGDLAGALKWLRRATEAAADADADDRTLELAKAAANLASASALGTATSPAQPTIGLPSVVLAVPTQGPFAPASSPALSAAAPESRPAVSGAAPSPPGPAIAPPAPPTPTSPTSATPAVPAAAPAAIAPKPPAQRPTFLQPMGPRPMPPGPRVEPWLVGPIDDDDLGDVASEKTRVGVPAYGAGAKTETIVNLPRSEDPALQPTQAMRVVVWRAADGVHVAPRGTHVSAIAVDALLVALDPSADLAAWLSAK